LSEKNGAEIDRDSGFAERVPSPGAVATPVAQPADEPATSANAQAARAVVEQYFALIGKHDYAAARAQWGNGGADAGGDAKAFADSFAIYSKYGPKVGDPTFVRTREGMQYVSVAVDVDVVFKVNGKMQKRSGAVMLRRSANPNETNPDRKVWRIWGSDIRRKH